MRVSIFLAFLVLTACGNAEEKKKQAEAQQKAFMEAEAKARAEADAKEAKAAIDKATSGCDSGDGAACVELGRIYFDGKGVERDIKKAVEQFAKACAKKSQEGCRLAAQHESDEAKKYEHLVALCDLKDADACFQGAALADSLVQAGKLKEAKKVADAPAMQLLKKACDLGGALACTVRGKGLLEEDAKQALASLSKGCELNEPSSCFILSDAYATGKGVKKKDAKKAAELKKKACDAGLKEAC